MCDVIPEWIVNAERFIRAQRLDYAFIDSHYWDAGLAGDGLVSRLAIPHVHTPHSIGAWKRDNMDGDPAELDRQYNFRRRIRDEKCDLRRRGHPRRDDPATVRHPPGDRVRRPRREDRRHSAGLRRHAVLPGVGGDPRDPEARPRPGGTGRLGDRAHRRQQGL